MTRIRAGVHGLKRPFSTVSTEVQQGVQQGCFGGEKTGCGDNCGDNCGDKNTFLDGGSYPPIFTLFDAS